MESRLLRTGITAACLTFFPGPGRAQTLPDIAVTPSSFTESLPSGDAVQRTLTVANTGGSDLTWRLTAGADSLESVLASLDAGFPSILASIPNRYAFTEGEAGDHIEDGGSNMYDGGNYLRTERGGPIAYSNGAVVDSPEFGPSGRYFTRKYPGLFVLAADLSGTEEFVIEGDLGANSVGTVDGTVAQYLVGGVYYLGFVKRVHGASGVPSVNHMLIVEERPGIEPQFATNSNSDFDRLSGLSGSTRLYYLLYAGAGGAYVDDQTTAAIMAAFLETLAPRWMSATPRQGVLPAGGSTDVSLVFDATDLIAGGYDSALTVSSDDPDEPEVVLPAHLQVTGAPELEISPTFLDFGSVFVHGSATRTVAVANVGTDALTIAGIASDHPDFVADASSFTVPAAESRTVTVTYTPSVPGHASATLSIASDDADEPEIAVELQGEGLTSADVTVSPASFDESLFTGQGTTRTLTIGNTGGAPLTWRLTAAGGATLEDVLAHLESGHAAITATIPNRYSFSEGEFGTSIGDGGSDMYDGGNILSTQLGGPIAYTNGGIVDSPVFGPSGRYFTRKYPGLFVLAANVAGAVTFAIEGNLGADGGGFADGTALDEFVAGVRYLGFVKRVHGAGDPSVNHLLIVEHRPELQHEFSSNTNDDFHALSGMSGSTRLYYLLYAGSGGTYIDDQATRGIFTAFLQSLGPRWLSAAPEEGVVPAGGSTGVALSFDATGLIGGDYTTTIAVSSDDPDETAVTVPVHLHVTGAADIDAAPASVDFGPVFVGSTATRTVFVSNIGTDVLEVSTVTSDHADFGAEPTSFSLAVGEGRDVTVTYAPSAPGAAAATLTFTSNDPDDPEVAVPLEGEGRIPPDVSASPASFSESLLTGQMVTRILTLENTGGSALDFEISVHTPPASVRPLPIDALPPISVGVSQSGTLAGGPADGPSTPSLQGTYSGTHLAFGITNYGEIMPFQSPPGREHLESGTFLSGHTVAYVAQGQDHACYAVNFEHACLTPQSYREVRNTPQLVEVEVISRTSDGALRIVQTITFQKSTRYFVMSAKVTNLLDTAVEDVVLKWVTDWDVDGDFYNLWDYDPARHAVLAWEGTYVAVAGVDSPALMDLYGWNDYFGRSTVVDYPSGPEGLDGAGLLHFDLGSLPPAVSREARVVFGAGPDLATLQKAIDAGRGTAQWIQLDTTTGTVPAGSSLDVPVTFVATGLIGGDYDAAIVVASNDPDEPEVSVPAHLHVTGAPDVEVTPASVDFGPVFVGNSAIRTVTVTNDGTDVLTVAGLTLDHPDFTTDPSGFTLAVGESRDVSVTYAPSAAVVAVASLVVASDDPDEPQAATALLGQGLIAPLLGYSRSSFSESLLTGQTVTRTLTFDNRGGSDLTFSIRVDSSATGQLRVAPSPPARRSLSPSPAATPRYDADRVPSRNPQRHAFAPDPAMASFPVLLVQGGGDTEDIRARLLEFTDISLIHVFDALEETPALENLLPYPVVLVASNNPFLNPVALGNVLADYVDAGGGVVLTLASFVDRWSIRGRFMDEGYSPFDVGTGPFGDASLGTYDAAHPIMAGVTTAAGSLLAAAPLKPDAKLVATWDNALPFVATQGDRVVAVNIYVANAGFWLGDIPRILHNALFWASGDKWLSTDPLSGVVAAGQTLDVAVTFNAAGLNDGDYDAALVVSSNDPHRPQARIPAFLHVTGAPDVEVTPLSLEFGVVYVGSSATREVTVANPGTAPLGVTAITFDHGDFTVDASSFTLAPHQRRTVHVTYAPSAPSAATSTMTIATNDPDEAQVALALQGEGRIPPDIATAPASFSETLFTGETVTRMLTIENTGGSDLTYQVSASTSADLAGQAHVLLVQDVFPWESNANQTVLSGLGIAFDTVGSESLASVDLGRYTHILVPSDQPTSFYFAFAANKARIDAWVGAGGVLEFHAAGWGWAGGDPSLVTLPGGMRIQPHGADQNFVLRPDHPLVEGVPSPFSGTSASHAYFTNIPAVATLVASDDFGRPNLVAYRQGTGLVVAGCQTFEFEFPAHAAGRILANMIPWADSLVSWLSLDPESGTVPAGGSVAVAVTFDATDLLGGDYQGAIRVLSNDPDEPERTVPMQLHVTGAPDIEVAPTSLDFGSLFVGATSIKTLSVTNDGTDVLTVESASFDHPDFAGDTTGFTLAVGESRTVTVTYAPSAAGSVGATLTLASDDSDEPEIAVSLAGVGIIAPDISVDPASVAAILAPGAASTRLLTVTNSGGSDLAFQIRSSAPFVGDLSILLLTAGADVDGLAAQLAALPDVGTVHQFDARLATPTLEDLAPYSAIVVISGLQEFAEADALGNVLASYVDGGGGVILTFSSFLAGWEVRGRFGAEGYSPFTLASQLMDARSLGAFQAGHPIFHGVSSVTGFPSDVGLAPGSQAVAEWTGGLPFVATQGSRVVGANIYLASPGTWQGDVLQILRNATLWLAGRQGAWLQVSTHSGIVPPGSSAPLTLTFDASTLAEGEYFAPLVLESNDPDEPVVVVPLSLTVASCVPADEVCNGIDDDCNGVVDDGGDTLCDDGDPCTADRCLPGSGCSHEVSGLCQASPRSEGFWRRLCRGPHPDGQITQEDVDCVNDSCTFAGVQTVAELCQRLDPAPPEDKCAQAEAQFMALTLNSCQGRIVDPAPILSTCSASTTIGQSRAEVDGLLCAPSRDQSTCTRAQCQAEEINSGRALQANSLRLRRLLDGRIRLTWAPPYGVSEAGPPTGYRVRRRTGSEAPFEELTDTSNLFYVDPGAQALPEAQYEVTPVWE